jgi:hypothetical protein
MSGHHFRLGAALLGRAGLGCLDRLIAGLGRAGHRLLAGLGLAERGRVDRLIAGLGRAGHRLPAELGRAGLGCVDRLIAGLGRVDRLLWPPCWGVGEVQAIRARANPNTTNLGIVDLLP